VKLTLLQILWRAVPTCACRLHDVVRKIFCMVSNSPRFFDRRLKCKIDVILSHPRWRREAVMVRTKKVPDHDGFASSSSLTFLDLKKNYIVKLKIITSIQNTCLPYLCTHLHHPPRYKIMASHCMCMCKLPSILLILNLSATYGTNNWNIKVVFCVKIYSSIALMTSSCVFQSFLVEKWWRTGLITNMTLNEQYSARPQKIKWSRRGQWETFDNP
jgi:hypothetical protein